MPVDAMKQHLKGYSHVLSWHLDFVKSRGYELQLTLGNESAEHITLHCETVSLLQLHFPGGIKQLWIWDIVDLRAQHLDVLKLRFDWLNIDEDIVSFHCAKATILQT